jgi:hypothetical protein
MAIPEVSSASEPAQPEQTGSGAQTSPTGSGVSANLTGIVTLNDLEAKAKPVADAIKFAIASNMCSAANRSNERIKETLREADRPG